MSDQRELRVVFDTSVIRSESETDVLRAAVRRFVLEHRAKKHDLRIAWFVPQMVIDERTYQMVQKARAHLTSLPALEMVLGRTFGVTEVEVESGVRRCIAEQLWECGISALPLQTGKVDWARVMDEAAARQPPFEPSNTEKGFRDACILETFVQLVDDAPSEPAKCRLVLVTGDNRLTEACEKRLAGRANVRVLRDMPAVEDLINTLVSNVSEAYVEARRASAANYFYDADSKTGLYFAEKLEARIQVTCSAEFQEQPKSNVVSNIWFVRPPIFETKNKTRIVWNSRVQYATTIRHEDRADDAAARFEAAVAVSLLAKALNEGARTLNLADIQRPSRLWTRTISADVTWSVRLSENTAAFEAPKIEGIQCQGGKWAPAEAPRRIGDAE